MPIIGCLHMCDMYFLFVTLLLSVLFSVNCSVGFCCKVVPEQGTPDRGQDAIAGHTLAPQTCDVSTDVTVEYLYPFRYNTADIQYG